LDIVIFYLTDVISEQTKAAPTAGPDSVVCQLEYFDLRAFCFRPHQGLFQKNFRIAEFSDASI
jgi:hypothetical protein